MNGATETKSLLLSRLAEDVKELQHGCILGKVHTEQIDFLRTALNKMEEKFWWLLMTNFVTLIGIAVNIAISFAKK